MRVFRIASGMLVVFGVTFLLFYLRDILIPFVLALILWSLVRAVESFIAKAHIGKSHPPRWVTGLLAFALIFGLLSALVFFLSQNIKGITEVLPVYQDTLREMKNEIVGRFGIDLSKELSEYLEKFNIATAVRAILNSMSSILGNAFLVLIYVIFLMMEERHFRPKLTALFRKSDNMDRTIAILHQIDDSLSRYVGLKTLVSLLTGALSYIALSIIGIDFAFFWAFLIFLLNYIPNIGSLIGTLFPALIAVLEFGDYKHALWVLISVGAIQTVVGNVIEPKVMGNSLNVSPLVVILSLVFWGFLWGVVGMVLSVPIMVMLIIIMSQFDTTRGAAIMLSEKGLIQKKLD